MNDQLESDGELAGSGDRALTSVGAACVDILAVELQVEMGRVCLPLREVLELDVGSTVAFVPPAAGSVTLRFNGEFVADAILTQEGGELFLEVISLSETKQISRSRDGE